MSEEIFLVTNLVKTQIITYNRFKIKNFDLKLNESVSIIILLYPEDPQHSVECRTIVIEGPDYEAWGNDDNYIIEYIKNKLQNKMNDIIIKGRTTPNIRHLIKGVLLAELLNKHLREKQRKMPLEMIYEIEMVSSDDEETSLLLKKN